MRWLRPEFQNPAGVKAAQQAEIETEAGEEETEAGAAPEAKAWPKAMPEQMKAVRERVTTWARSASAEEVAAAFKKAPRKEVELVLECLVAVGAVVEMEGESGRMWRATARQA